MRGLGFGIISEPDRRDSVADLGFNWVKYLVIWKDAQPQRGGAIDFSTYDDWVDKARAKGLRVLLRIDDPPSWATGTTEKNAPPLDDNDLADFVYQMVNHLKGRVDAWELWNEPNLNYEWGYRRPDPARYTQMLKAVYPRLKAADPQALLILGGLSTTGGDFNDDGNEGHIGDLGYLTKLAQSGAAGYFDAIGSHPYGGPYPPEQDYDINNTTTPVGLYFRRSELQHEAWLRATGQDMPVWVTEFGWIQDFGQNCTWADAGSPWGRQAQKVSPQQQADYLVRAFQYARANWPWIGPMIIFNLDKAAGTSNSCDNNYERYFGILGPDGSATPAYTALKAMTKVDNQAPVSQMTSLSSYSTGTFTVTWSAADNPGGSGIQSYDVQQRETSGPWSDLLTATTQTSATITGNDGQRLSFRVRARDKLGNQESFHSDDGDVSTTVDATPPNSSVLSYAVPVTSTFFFPVRWSGSDGGSGLSNYDVQYRSGITGTWTNLVSAVTYTQTNFYNLQDKTTYFFRSRAKDKASNVEAYPDDPDSQMIYSWTPYITSVVASPVWIGQYGGALAPQKLVFVNYGAYSTNWQASDNASWLSVSPTSGTIAAGSTATITLQADTPVTGTGTVRYDATIIITGTSAWNSPITVSATVYAVDVLNSIFLPFLGKSATGW